MRHKKETIEKIRAARLAQEMEKKTKLATVEAAQALEPVLKATLIESRLRSFADISPERLASIIRSSESGRLSEWAEFCDALVLKDAHLAGLVSSRRNEVAGKPLSVQAFVDTEEAKESAQIVKTVINGGRNLHSAVFHLLFAPYSGVSVVEIVWKWDSALQLYTIKDLIPVHSKKLMYNDSLELCINDTNSEYNGKPLSNWPNKFIVHTPHIFSPYPNTDGIFRVAAWFSWFKQRGLAYWLNGAERFAFPSLVATVPNNTPAALLDNIRTQMETLVSTGVAAVKEGIKFSQLGAAGNGDQVWMNLCRYLDAQMSKLIVGATLSVDAGSAGSYALGEVHERVRNDIAVGDAEALARTLERDLATAILAMNSHRISNPVCPSLYFDGVKMYPQISQMHVDAGIVRKNDLRRELALPEIPIEEGGEDFIPAKATAENIGAQPQTESLSNVDSTNGVNKQ